MIKRGICTVIQWQIIKKINTHNLDRCCNEHKNNY